MSKNTLIFTRSEDNIAEICSGLLSNFPNEIVDYVELDRMITFGNGDNIRVCLASKVGEILGKDDGGSKVDLVVCYDIGEKSAKKIRQFTFTSKIELAFVQQINHLFRMVH